MTDLGPEAIAKALGGAKAVAGGWVCKCPAHEDKHASLSITHREGKTLWHCHAGCTQEAVRDALVHAGLIEERKASGDAAKPPRRTGRALRTIEGGKDKSESPGRIVATYDYVDVTGSLLFQVVRFEPKTFRQRRPKGSGWEWGLGRITPIIYRLPEASAADTVLVVEGEKDVENLRAIGFTATTSPMGAGKWRHEYGASLAGKHVIVLPDNDEPGRKHALEIAQSCADHGAKSIRIVELPGLPEKGDPSDWIAAGGTADELKALIRRTEKWSIAKAGGDPGWRTQLLVGDDGPLANEFNVKVALERAPELAGRLRYDAFKSARECRNLPWDSTADWRPWSDEDTTQLACWLQEQDINIRPLRVDPVVSVVARQVEQHAVREYLDRLKWDGKSRLADWLSSYLGCSRWTSDGRDIQAYLRAVGRCWVISAVARVYRPGCKVDTVLILEGPQGHGKSTAIARLCSNPAWFADEIGDLGSKDAAQSLPGKWLIEMAELDHISRAEIERIKAFVSRSVDHYRPSYGRTAQDFARGCVFFGTTNEDAYLRDSTGNRRFWPAKVGQIFLDLIEQDRDQLWAEAVHLFRAGERWWLTKDEEKLAGEEQSTRLEPEPWAEAIESWLAQNNGLGLDVTVSAILRDGVRLATEKVGQREQNRVAAYLRSTGWRRIQKRSLEGKRRWAYERKDQ